MPAQELPAEFKDGRQATKKDLDAAVRPGRKAIQILERCIAEHHVVEIEYTDRHGHRSTIQTKPRSIRLNKSGHLVLWGHALDDDALEQLWLERMDDVRDTGETFEPAW